MREKKNNIVILSEAKNLAFKLKSRSFASLRRTRSIEFSMIYTQLLPYLVLSGALFSIGLYGILQRRSLIAILISAELVLNAANINFLAFGRFTNVDKAVGQIYSIFVIGLAAAEVAIGLSIVMTIYRKFRSINVEKLVKLKG